jgi:ribose 5-phosphate isomerase B
MFSLMRPSSHADVRPTNWIDLGAAFFLKWYYHGMDMKPRKVSMARNEALHPDGLVIPHRPAIVVASDHAGFPMKGFVRDLLADHFDEVISLGATSEEPVDFPDVTRAAVDLILSGKVERAVLVCGTGAGACIAANKIAGIRAAVAMDTYVARQAVIHDNINVLCIGAWLIGPQIVRDVVRAFLAAEFSTEEHFRRRVAKLDELECQQHNRGGRNAREQGQA